MEHCTCAGGCGSAGSPAADPALPALTHAMADDRGAVSRRGVLTGSAAALAALALAACAGSDEADAGASTTPEQTPSADPASPSASESASTPEAAGPTGEALASTSEFPTGGGKVVTLGGTVVVVTQPEDGRFVAFNGKCPHAGCPVAEVTENTIVCTCHGSTFDGATGDRLEGPAPTGLEPVPVTVEGDTVYLA